MKPGRELDMLVAEKVMGYSIIIRPQNEMTIDGIIKTNKYFLSIGDCSFLEVPFYSTNIAAAWEAVVKISYCWPEIKCHRAFGWSCTVRIDCLGKDYYHPVVNWASDGETAPHAICLAALKTIDPVLPDQASTQSGPDDK